MLRQAQLRLSLAVRPWAARSSPAAPAPPVKPYHRQPMQQRRRQQHSSASGEAAAGGSGPAQSPVAAVGSVTAAAAAAGKATAVSAAQPQPPPKPKQAFQFCRMCGGRVELVLPQGDGLWRHQCTQCGYIDYQNPRLVVGCIVQHEGRILLCRRGIEPSKGLWTVPAGYLECGEATAAGAARETWEEAGARVEVDAPYCTFDIPGISQVYLLFRARLAPPYTFAAQQPESLDAQLFAPEDIPWDQLAFSSVSIALKNYIADLAAGAFTVHHGVIQKRPGSGPNEPGSFQLIDHIAVPTTSPATQ